MIIGVVGTEHTCSIMVFAINYQVLIVKAFKKHSGYDVNLFKRTQKLMQPYLIKKSNIRNQSNSV